MKKPASRGKLPCFPSFQLIRKKVGEYPPAELGVIFVRCT